MFPFPGTSAEPYKGEPKPDSYGLFHPGHKSLHSKQINIGNGHQPFPIISHRHIILN